MLLYLFFREKEQKMAVTSTVYPHLQHIFQLSG